MRFIQTKLNGAWLVEPDPVVDERGSFARTFCEKEFENHGMETRFVQHSQSHSSRRGTLRGMHFQQAPYSEVKLVSCIAGAIYDVIVDMRPFSPTLHQWIGFELSPQNRRQVYVPEGFAHGFQTLSDDAVVSYMISQFYTPHASTGVKFDDPVFAIDWPLEPTAMSDRDREWPLLKNRVLN